MIAGTIKIFLASLLTLVFTLNDRIFMIKKMSDGDISLSFRFCNEEITWIEKFENTARRQDALYNTDNENEYI